MIPFRVRLESGGSICEQVVFAATRAMVSGQMRTGETFPSVRALSRELKINPNTAHKVIAQLVEDGLLETRPGIGTMVTAIPNASRREQAELLGAPVEELVVRARRLSIPLEALLDGVRRQWQQIATADDGGNERKDGR